MPDTLCFRVEWVASTVINQKNFDRKFGLRMLISLLLLGWLIFSIDWRKIWSTMAGINPVWLLPAVGWIVIAIVVSVIKWQLILRAQNVRVEWRDIWRAYWIGLFFNNFLPSSIGGDVFRVLYIGKLTNDPAGVTASVVAERLLSALAMAFLGLTASFWASGDLLQVRVLLIILLTIALLLTGWLAWGWMPAFVTMRQGRIANFIGCFISCGGWLRKHPTTLLWTLLWSMVFQAAYVAANLALFRGLQLFQVDLWDAMFIMPATGALAMIPLSINGYGIRESAYMLLLAPLGVSKASAFSASVLFAFLVSLCSLWGGILWLGTNSRKEGVINAHYEGG